MKRREFLIGVGGDGLVEAGGNLAQNQPGLGQIAGVVDAGLVTLLGGR